VHPNEKKKPFFSLYSLTLTVVARRKGRHQKKKKTLFAHGQCSGTPQEAPPTKKKKKKKKLSYLSLPV
jgi:hypothetical protein